ncbi:cell division cycle protein 37 [Tremella mesenterica]|uniref:Hsp90 chaperone protein kinase-targeting subunit n=1 Tax=Tremella mesenterica TaxID=5217 RepID=A0A4Q1BVL8_TREME|nr:cell division cycle protein 37 [Tremella mesenterica]
MPLNYSKWDRLELSDDSDIEEHPNVDKKSMIRWKQRDIHEKRQARKLKIAKLQTELALNAVLRPRIQAILVGTSEKGVDHFRAVQRRMQEQPSPEKPPTDAPNQPTYDQMLGQLLGDVFLEAAYIADGAVIEDDALVSRLSWHLELLDRRDVEAKKEMEEEEQEQKKRITSEDIHEGWDSSSVVKVKPSPLEDKPKPVKKEAKKVENIEVLNPGASSSTVDPASSDDTDDETDLTLSAAARAFVQIPIGDFEKSYAFIQKDSSVLTEQTHDAILGEAFDAERRGDKALAKRCVHQSLLVNYCRQLGRNGVGLFFQKMISRNPQSIKMFNEDLKSTYARIETRTQQLMAEESQDREQIQLVAEDPNMQIGFNIPDGPPPAELKVEGEGAETLDIEEVRAFLQHKWEIFTSFSSNLQTALKTEKLDEVNKVLGVMKVSEAEKIVELMQEGGMLSFR